MDLQTLWFAAVAVLWTGFLLLEGFDFGVAALLPVLGRRPADRHLMLRSIGPLWDGNEVWLITAAGAVFAAFPGWYATWLPALYLPFVIVLLGLIVRAVAFEWRHSSHDPRWDATWTHVITAGSLVAALGVGAALGRDHARACRSTPTATGSAAPSPGSAGRRCSARSRSLGVRPRPRGAVPRAEDRRRRAAAGPGAGAALVAGRRAAAARAGPALVHLRYGTPVTAVLWLVAALAVVVTWARIRVDREGQAFAALGGAAGRPRPPRSSAPPTRSSSPRRSTRAFDVTVADASVSDYTLTVMTWVAGVGLPVVLAYQAWTYWVFRKRLTAEPQHEPDGAEVPADARPRAAGGAGRGARAARRRWSGRRWPRSAQTAGVVLLAAGLAHGRRPASPAWPTARRHGAAAAGRASGSRLRAAGRHGSGEVLAARDARRAEDALRRALLAPARRARPPPSPRPAARPGRGARDHPAARPRAGAGHLPAGARADPRRPAGRCCSPSAWTDLLSAGLVAVTLPLVPLFMVLVGQVHPGRRPPTPPGRWTGSPRTSPSWCAGCRCWSGLGRAAEQTAALARLGEAHRTPDAGHAADRVPLRAGARADRHAVGRAGRGDRRRPAGRRAPRPGRRAAPRCCWPRRRSRRCARWARRTTPSEDAALAAAEARAVLAAPAVAVRAGRRLRTTTRAAPTSPSPGLTVRYPGRAVPGAAAGRPRRPARRAGGAARRRAGRASRRCSPCWPALLGAGRGRSAGR